MVSQMTYQNWLVVGGGVSGYGAAALLDQTAQSVLVSDRKAVLEPLRTKFTALKSVKLAEGEQTETLLQGIEAVVVSPGIPPKIPLLVAAKNRNLPIYSEISLGLSSYQGEVFAVTGTNGKSTVCVMLEALLNKLSMPATAGGNLGDALALQIAEKRSKANLVLELSSYQIESSPGIKVAHAAFTSFSFDHIDRHGTLENYFRAKWDLIKSVKPGGLIVMPLYIYRVAQDYQCKVPEHAETVLILNEKDCPSQAGNHRWLRINGDGELTDKSNETLAQLEQFGFSSAHNRLNATIAALFGRKVRPNASWQELFSAIATFTPLPFRCEPVGKTASGHMIINDSKSTNVESTLTALSVHGAPFLLLMGGQGKIEPYKPILEKRNAIKALVCFGASGSTIQQELAGHFPTYSFPTLKEACAALPELYRKHPATLLLSPACASFDEFKNYEHRGTFFSEQMRELFDLTPVKA